MNTDWNHPMQQRARIGGEQSFDGRVFRGGEFMPFYIPRPEMPQIDGDKYPEFVNWLDSEGIGWGHKVFRPDQLRAHQRVNMHIVRTMNKEDFDRDILVTRDEFILDGNHRWAAHKLRDALVTAIWIQMDFMTMLDKIWDFPGVYAYGDGEHIRI